MANLQFANPHNNAAELEEHPYNQQFHDILRFLRHSHIAFALTTNPNIHETPVRDFWRTAEQDDVNGVATITARVCGRQVSVTESTIRSQLHLNDEGGISSYPSQTILDTLDRMGHARDRGNHSLVFQKALFPPQWKYLIHVLQTCISRKRSCWNEFNLTHAAALIALATGELFNFSKMIFNDMLGNISSPPKNKFLMYPRFLQIILEHLLGKRCHRGNVHVLPPLSKHNFSNMGRTTAGVLRRDAPLFSTMMVASADERVESLSTAQPTSAGTELDIGAPTAVNPTSQPTNTSPPLKTYKRTKRFPSPPVSQKKLTQSATLKAKTPKSVSTKPDQHEPLSKLTKKVVTKKGRDHAGRALTTAATPSGRAQDSENINKTPTAATPYGGPRCQETEGEMDASARQEIHSERSDESQTAGTQQGSDKDSFDSDVDLDQLCKVLTETQRVPTTKPILKKSSDEPTTTGTQKLVGEDSIDTLNFNELTVTHSVPNSPLRTSNEPPVVGTQQQVGEDSTDLTTEELTAKVEALQKTIDSMLPEYKRMVMLVKKLSFSYKPKEKKFKGERVTRRRRLVKLSTPSSSSSTDDSKNEDDLKGEVERFQEEEEKGIESAQGTGTTFELNVDADDRRSEVIETTDQQLLVVPSQIEQAIEVDPTALAFSSPTSAGELTTGDQVLTTADNELQTAVIEERVTGTGYLTPMNFKFSRKGTAGASTSSQTLSEEQRIAEFIERQRLDRLMEYTIRLEAEKTIANQDKEFLRRRGQNLNIRASLPPKKVYVEGKGKQKMLILTKKEKLMKFHIEQELARQAREVHDDDTLRAMLGDKVIEGDLMAWRIIEMEKERKKREEFARKLKNDRIRREIEQKEKEKLERELLEKEIKKELEEFFSNPIPTVPKIPKAIPKAVYTKRSTKRKSRGPQLQTDQAPSKRQKMIDYFISAGLYSWDQLKKMKTDRMENMYDVFRDREREELVKVDEPVKKEAKVPSETEQVQISASKDQKVRSGRKKSMVEGNKKKKSERKVREKKKSERKSRKKRKLKLVVVNKSESTQQEDKSAEEEILHVKPLYTDVPIIDWYLGEQEGKTAFVVKKADGSIQYYRTIPRIFQDMSRKEIVEMHAVGLKMHKNVAKGASLIGLLLDYLRRMFEPDLFKYEISRFNRVRSWEIYDDNGIYYIQMVDETQYYLVEMKYNHHVEVMRALIEKPLRRTSQYENMLSLKLAGQIIDIETGLKKKD